ncbi:hypothetical protein FA95DRAFT_1592488 [Auriscalpium vulgare]|uniref:Uncharacterized protein n=1 Tax=Auriscalpium vulgare TaxID=40419 RepID=A0ACB8S9D6_9AGAM|nr:hypothetical protein FA95DRAFT_1592488 [Auriscalpium vulgare]
MFCCVTSFVFIALMMGRRTINMLRVAGPGLFPLRWATQFRCRLLRRRVVHGPPFVLLLLLLRGCFLTTSMKAVPPAATDADPDSHKHNSQLVAPIVVSTLVACFLLIVAMLALWQRHKRAKVPDHLVPRPFMLQAPSRSFVGSALRRASTTFRWSDGRQRGSGDGGGTQRSSGNGGGHRAPSSSPRTPHYQDSHHLLADMPQGSPHSPYTPPDSAATHEPFDHHHHHAFVETLDDDYLPDLLPESPIIFLPHAMDVSPAGTSVIARSASSKRSALPPPSPVSPPKPSRAHEHSGPAQKPRRIRPLPPLPLPTTEPLRVKRSGDELRSPSSSHSDIEMRPSRWRMPGATDPVMPAPHYWSLHRWYKKEAERLVGYRFDEDGEG